MSLCFGLCLGLSLGLCLSLASTSRRLVVLLLFLVLGPRSLLVQVLECHAFAGLPAQRQHKVCVIHLVALRGSSLEGGRVEVFPELRCVSLRQSDAHVRAASADCGHGRGPISSSQVDHCSHIKVIQ